MFAVTDSKCGCPQGHVGSNPTFSAKTRLTGRYIACEFCYLLARLISILLKTRRLLSLKIKKAEAFSAVKIPRLCKYICMTLWFFCFHIFLSSFLNLLCLFIFKHIILPKRTPNSILIYISFPKIQAGIIPFDQKYIGFKKVIKANKISREIMILLLNNILFLST